MDFIKAILPPDSLIDLIGNEQIQWKCDLNIKTGEVVQYPIIGKLDTFKIEVKSEKFIQLSGSLHKYHEGGCNYSDFNIQQIAQAINRLCDTIQVKPNECILSNLEYGINIKPPITPKALIKRIVAHKTEFFEPMQWRTSESLGIVAKHQRYFIKIYDKGKQYNLQNPTLRIENKNIKMADLKALGVQTLADVKNPSNLALLANNLLRNIEDLLIIQEGFKSLSKPERKVTRLIRCKYDLEQLKHLSIRKFHYYKRRYHEIIHSQGKVKTNEILIDIAAKKLKLLLNSKKKLEPN